MRDIKDIHCTIIINVGDPQRNRRRTTQIKRAYYKSYIKNIYQFITIGIAANVHYILIVSKGPDIIAGTIRIIVNRIRIAGIDTW